MLNAVLFDLDNTLIQFSERKFFESYLTKVTPWFTDIIPAEIFVERLLLSAHALMNNDGQMLNDEYFMSVFSYGYEEHRDELQNRFIKFYETDYHQLRSLVSVPQGVREVFLKLRRKSVKIVVASNPIWPLSVQTMRLSWAGIGDFHFDLVTHLGNTSYCKPRIEYYQEICLKIDEQPETCLMVGNDPIYDLVVAKIGMRTFLITAESKTDESLLELSRIVLSDMPTEIPVPDFTGPLSDVPDAVDALLRDNRIK